MLSIFNNIEFLNPWLLWLLLLLPIMAAWYYFKKRKQVSPLNISTTRGLGATSFRTLGYKYLIPLLRGLALTALIVAIARPQKFEGIDHIKDGIDIMMVMDLSSSMLAQDFKPDRLEESKRVAAEFIEKRTSDRIGLVVFGGESFTQCPLTTDHKILKDFLAGIQCGLLEDGTAIGMGLATAVNRLKDSQTKSKIVILLTDGVNNAGYVKPLTAAEIAREFDVKTYTIGVGSTGAALTPVSRRSNGAYIFDMRRVEIDEQLLRQIAQMTGGKYYRATSSESLEAIYNEIDKLERTKIKESIPRYSEKFYYFALAALALLFLELILRTTILRLNP